MGQNNSHQHISLRGVFEMGGEMIVRGLTKKQFQQLAADEPELRMERESNGDITIMAPVHGGGSIRENSLSFRVNTWNYKDRSGQVFSPSGGFDLPNGATKSPDVAWVSAEKMAKLSYVQIEKSFIPIVPDFVAEVRSGSDRLLKVQEKMRDTWIANGVRLAWLIDPFDEKAYVYRLNGSVDVIEGFEQNRLSGEDVLPGFVLELKEFRLYGKK